MSKKRKHTGTGQGGRSRAKGHRGRHSLAVGASAAIIVAGLSSSSPQSAADEVGMLRPSMTDMSASSDVVGFADSSSAVSLSVLSEDVAEGYGNSDFDGSGIDVALIDTGIAPVPGLVGVDKVLYGPDLSKEGASPAANLDTYGHGTHMAGIIAGNRAGDAGVAPGARLVSVKVAGHDGATTVPQVVAAIDWVIDHRSTDGLNIRVLNLSLGQAGVDSHIGDHLSAAVERAWHAGIFVVVAGGNQGTTAGHLDSPAIDPYVFAVAGVDSTIFSSNENRQGVADWSSRGDHTRDPDASAPGLSILSYRVPGSTIDLAVPSARHGDDLFTGSGTSQSAAAVSGLAARILDHRPDLTPDELKETLRESAVTRVEYGRTERVGEGVVNADEAYAQPRYGAEQEHPPAAGPDSDLAKIDGPTWRGGTWSGGTWSGGTWSGATWSGATWSGATWSGGTWSGATWSGGTWSGATWSGTGWS